jgi:arylsulfatase A-like enzyme
MNVRIRYTRFLILSPLVIGACQSDKEKEENKVNIIYILADDLGYGELGCYGQEKIETPNIDALAKNGVRFTQHYSGSAVSAPSRCSLLTGLHSGHSFIRGNHEWGSRGNVWNYRAMIKDSTLEGQFPMPDSTITIASMLKDAGYKTGMVGKWGLGAPHSNSIPTRMGFDFFYGYNCQRIAHTYYPVHLYKNEYRMMLNNDTIKPHLKLEAEANPEQAECYAQYNLTDYAPDIMHHEMLNFIEENSRNPFFMYWATPIPHLPLQAPQRWVDYYRDRFGDETPLVNASYYPHQYPRAAYAAMISYLDEQVGELIDKLKELGVYENTLIIFTSDNGPTYIDADVQWFKSAAPLRTDPKTNKGYLHEGGIRVPMIVSWPGNIKAGSSSQHISAFWDVMPTLCDVADIEPSAFTDGISFLPELTGAPQIKHDHLYWEFPGYGGQQAVRKGSWKAIRKGIHKENMDIELYNLDTDLQEIHDLSGDYPEMVKEMDKIMKLEHVTSAIDRFRLSALDDI